MYTLHTSTEFSAVASKIANERQALYVFDIDNTLLITNNNQFGSDWWFEQTGKRPELKDGISDSCLFNVLTPLFYSVFNTRPVFQNQPEVLQRLNAPTNRTIALTSRSYSPVIAGSTVMELRKNNFAFMHGSYSTLSNGFIMDNGIIYTSGGNKGTALLDYLSEHPASHVYYFDDSESKVKAVQKAFTEAQKPISIYHVTIAAKVPYTNAEVRYMQQKLRLFIQAVNANGSTPCNCKN
jgi:hypothetical protein